MAFLTDSSASNHTLTLAGDAAAGGVVNKFGGALTLGTLNGSGSCQSADSADWNFGTGAFTVEGWFYPTALPTNTGDTRSLVTLIGQSDDTWPGTNTDIGWFIDYTAAGGSPGLRAGLSFNGVTSNATSGGSFALNNWHHLVMQRDASGNWSFYNDGTRQFNLSGYGVATFDSPVPLFIGNDNSGVHEFKGVVGPIRITKGVARYSGATISVPGALFPVGSGSDANWSSVVLLAQFQPSNTFALTGNAATAAVGTMGVSENMTLALTGNALSGVAGGLGPENLNGGTESLALGGVQSQGVAGSLNKFLMYPIALTLPTPQLAAVGWESDKTKNLTGLVQLALPAPQVAATLAQGNTGTVSMTLPVPAFAANGSTPIVGTVALALPKPLVAGMGLTGLSGSVALSLPVPVFTARNLIPNAAALTLPTPQLVITGGTGLVGTVALKLPTPQLVAGAQVPFTGRAAMQLPVPALAAQGLAGIVGLSSNTLQRFALAIEGSTGVLGTVSLSLPVFALDIEGYSPVIGAVQLALPALQLVATGTTKNAGTPSAIVMHTETMGLTSYSNFPFNSFAQFNGVFLGAGDNGLFALTGDTDNGAAIQAAARVGITDFATSHLKRVDRIYVGYRTDGNLVLRIFTDEIDQRDYRLTATGRAGLHGNHVRLGKGLAARYWQFEVRNENGADFDLNMIELKPTALRRRIGGDDA